MNKPKWQRAQLVPFENDVIEVPKERVGCQLWVRCVPASRIGGSGQVFSYEGYDSNVIDNHSYPHLFVAAEALELLARDENDFADDVPLISFEEWLEEGQPSKEVA